MISVSGKAEYLFPFSSEIYGKAIAGQLIIGNRDRYGIQYDKQVKKLAERIVWDERSNG